jgi:localization factor PodJL
MKPGIPWSVKGIDDKAREIAKDAARSQGQTLGQWLNLKILESAGEEADLAARATRKKASSSVTSRTSRSGSAATPRGKSADAAQHKSTADDNSIERKLDFLVSRLSDLQERDPGTDRPRHALSAVSRPEQASNMAMDRLLDRIEKGEQHARESVKTLGRRVEKIGDRVEEIALRPVEINAREVPGFSALEGAVRSIVDRIEKTDTQSRAAIGQLQNRIVELDGKVQSTSPNSDKSRIVADLEVRMKELAARVEQTANSGEDPQLKAMFEARIRELAERIDTVRHSAEAIGQKAQATAGKAAQEQASAIETRLAELVEQAEQKLKDAGSSDKGLLSIQSEISDLHNRFEEVRQQSASEQEVQALRSALEMLSSRVDEAPGPEPIAQIEQRISDLSQQLQQVSQPADYQPQLGALEERIEALDSQIAASSSEAIPQITTQMNSIEQRLSATEKQLGGLATIENSIQKLFASLEEGRAEARTLATSAAMTASGGTTEPSAELQALQDGLAAVRANAETADQRTQATLEAVHETLAQIITKLGEFDSQKDAAVHPAQSAAVANRAERSALTDEAASFSAAPQATAPQASPADEAARNDMNDSTFLPSSPDGHGSEITSGTQPSHDPLLASADSQSEPKDWLSVVRSHMAEQHGISPGLSMSMAAQTMAEGDDADLADEHVDFIAAARLAAATGQQNPAGVPLEAAPSDLGGFSPRADDANPQPDQSASGLSRKLRKKSADSGGSDSPSGSNRKRLILAAAVLLAAVSAYTTNAGLFNLTSDTKDSISAPAIDKTSSRVAPVQEHKPQSLPASTDLPTSAAPVEATETTDHNNRMQADPITTSSVAPADTSDPLLSQLPNRPENVPTPFGAAELPEQIGPAELRHAALNGNANAQFIIASRYLEGRKIGRDHAKAAQWYTRAAESGLAAAQYRIGTLYERGSGVAQDRVRAMSWYAKAATQGNIKAMHNLAVMSADTANGKPDMARAATWFAAAAQHGLPDSQYNLAVLNERGLGVEKNIKEAYKWYAIGAKSGDRDAIKKTRELTATLDKATLARIEQSIASWQPTAPRRAANLVSISDSSWGIESNTRQASAKAPAGQLSTQPASAQDRIRLVQQLLASKGFDTGSADGEMGPSTANAIRLYQLRNGLPVNGIASKQLLEHLQKS